MTRRLKEQRLWDSFSGAAKGRLHLTRIENQLQSVPDVIGINDIGTVFWLELKALDEWPKRESTKPLLGSFERGQLPFMRAWESRGGFAFVLLRITSPFEWLLLRVPHGAYAPDLRQMTREQLLDHAAEVSEAGPLPIITHLQFLEP